MIQGVYLLASRFCDRMALSSASAAPRAKNGVAPATAYQNVLRRYQSMFADGQCAPPLP